MKNKTKLGLAGVVLAGVTSLGLGGCMGTFDVFDPYKSQRVQQWVEINGQMGFINLQGLGFVPERGRVVGEQRYYIYKYVNGQWIPEDRPIRTISGHTFEVIYK